MLKNRNILFFSADDWGCGLMTSKTHIADILSEENNLLYINSIGLREPKISAEDTVKIFRKLGRFFKGAQKVKNRMWVYTPIVIPFHRFKIVQTINKWLLISYIRFLKWKLKLTDPILFTFLPNTVDVVGKLGAKKIVYYCVDEFSEFVGVPTKMVIDMEKRLIEKSDIVFATSLKLYDNKRKFNNNTYFMPHGVDVAHFSKALDSNTVIPKDIADIPHPVVGFFGLIEEWIDQELIIKIAREKPDWSILLIGKINADISRLKEYKNIHIIGARNYKDLPSYCKIFDVATIPFVINELTLNVNPIKLREYLAAGIPVVSTSLPEVKSYSDHAYIADNHDEFLKALEIAINANTPENKRSRMDFIKNESWMSKIEKISDTIEGKT
jgi:glycosyltransferase involved in cell wall biosynthesis